jgi:exodeoxyribonuclease-3
MLLVTWNVNSIRAREERLRAFLERKKPDVVCLQELKCEEGLLPSFLLQDGWYVAAAGQRTYNGVAILSRTPLEDVRSGLGDREDAEGPEPARLISARVNGVQIISAYFPNGQALGSEKYLYKQRWIDRLRAWLALNTGHSIPYALCGDFNVAPEPRDVYDPLRWGSTVLHSPDIRERLEKLRANAGLVDAFRLHNEGNIYSWWDYRAGSFHRDQGLRIDHVFCTPDLAARCTAAEVDREERKGTGASDHAPVLVTFRDE